VTRAVITRTLPPLETTLPAGHAILRYLHPRLIINAAKAEELTLEGKVEQARKIRDTNFSAFRNALKIMHGISLKLFAPRSVVENMSGGVYLHVSESGVIDVLSEDEPIKHPEITIASI